MKKINLIAIALLCSCNFVSAMDKLLKQTRHDSDNNGIFVGEDVFSFYRVDDKKALSSFKKKRLYDPESLRVSGPAITYGLSWREIPKASLLLSMPVVTLMAGTTAYEYGLPLVMSMGCSFGTAVSYILILKKILR